MKDKTKSGGIGFLGLLGIVFITLKLCGVINWSWWLVTLPFWVGFGLWAGAIIIGILVFAVSIIIWAIRDIRSKHK